MPALTQDTMLEIIRRLQTGEGSEEEENVWLEMLEQNVPHPSVSDLIFYDDLSPEEILTRALDYKSVSL